MTPRSILVIEDEAALARALGQVCENLGARAVLCASGEQGLRELAGAAFHLVLLDIGLPDMSGLRVLRRINQMQPAPPVVILTAHGTLDNAVAARQLGAVEYLVKPLELTALEATLRRRMAAAPSPARHRPAEATTAPADDLNSLLGGASESMQQVFVAIAHATASEAPALITGPTGSGKSLVARVIHANSRRRAAPFVTLVCSALQEHLLESELFGHEKNAFTGAATMRPGHLERATGGTLFLDEIGDLPPAVQAKLLRFVEDKSFTRVGGRQDLQVDLRLITATHRHLREDVRNGRFREDLYYRLRVLEIELPPLARRQADLPALSAFFLGRLAAGRPLELSSEVLCRFQEHDWPGNVRELRNALEHAVAVCTEPLITLQHLPRDLRLDSTAAHSVDLAMERAVQDWITARLSAGATYKEMEAAMESTMLRHLLRHFKRKPSVLARALKMNRATLLKKRRKLGIADHQDS